MHATKRYLVVLWFMGLASIPMSMVPAQVFNYLTGLLQNTGDVAFSAVWPVIVLYFLCRVGIALLDVARTVLNGYYLENIVRAYTLKVFGRVLRISPDFFRRHDAARISNRVIRDTRTVESFWLNLKVQIPLAVIGLLAYGYVLFFGLSAETPVIGRFLGSHTQQGNWLIGSLIIIFAPVQSFFLFFDKRIQRINREAALAGDDIVSKSYETVAGVNEIRGHNAFDFAMSRVSDAYSRFRRVQLRMLKLNAFFRGFGPFLNALVNCILLELGALLCLGDLNLPVLGVTVESIRWQDYLGFVFMAMAVHGYIGSIMQFYFRWRMTRQTIKRVDEYAKSPVVFVGDEHAPDVDGRRDELVFDGIGYETGVGTRILADLNIEVKPGEHVALVGPSGCGKSTALNLIVRDIAPSSGKVAFDTTPVHEADFESLAGEVALVPQRAVLFDMSIRNNVLLGLRRPSDKTVTDAEGPVDVSRLPDVPDSESLDDVLLRTMHKVGLTGDLIKKALDSPCPDSWRKRSRILEAREHLGDELRERILRASPDLVEPFDRGAYLRQCTVRENLLFGFSAETDVAAMFDDEFEGPTRRLNELLSDHRLHGRLLNLGRWRFVREQRSGGLVRQVSPKLYNILTALTKAGYDASDIAASTETQTENGIANLSRHHRTVLFEVALDTRADLAETFFTTGSGFVEDVLEARNMVTADGKMRKMDVRHFDDPDAAGWLRLRESLIGGRVNPRIRASFEQVDALIVDALSGEDLLDELVLMGMEYRVGDRGRNLSGGQGMKVAIARAVVKNPNVLLMDEVTAPLDEGSQARVMNMVREDFAHRTVIAVSHRLSSIRDFDRILVFDRGHVVQQGSYEQLYAEHGLFRTLVDQQEGRPPSPSPRTASQPAEAESATEQSVQMQRVLALSPLFSNMDSSHIAMLERFANIVECAKGTVLFHRGDDGDEFFIILEGSVQFFLKRDDADGLREEIVDTFGPGQAFGELALFGDVPRTLGARAVEDARLCTIKRDDLIRLIEASPGIAIALLQTVSRRMAGMVH
ncbi:MAG: ATP-binding cassette domain-containing protein [Desulfatibacillaceae bacterium]